MCERDYLSGSNLLELGVFVCPGWSMQGSQSVFGFESERLYYLWFSRDSHNYLEFSQCCEILLNNVQIKHNCFKLFPGYSNNFLVIITNCYTDL